MRPTGHSWCACSLSALLMMSYYIRWYKTGVQPKIQKDAIYWFYRTQPAAVDAGVPQVKNRFGPVKDVIYCSTNLTAPSDAAFGFGRPRDDGGAGGGER